MFWCWIECDRLLLNLAVMQPTLKPLNTKYLAFL